MDYCSLGTEKTEDSQKNREEKTDESQNFNAFECVTKKQPHLRITSGSQYQNEAKWILYLRIKSPIPWLTPIQVI